MKTILSILLFLPLLTFSQTQNSIDNVPSIEVIGIAEKEIAPNKITIKIVFQENNDKNTISIEEQENNLKSKLKEKNFDTSKLLIQNVNSYLYRINRKTSDVNNRKEYSIIVSNSEEAYKVFKILDEINVKEAKIIETSHTEIQNYRKEVKKLALQTAKEKATELLKSIGEEIDKPLLIKEIEENSIAQNNLLSNVAVGYYKEYKTENGADYLELQPIKLKYLMFAKFKIK